MEFLHKECNDLFREIQKRHSVFNELDERLIAYVYEEVGKRQGKSVEDFIWYFDSSFFKTAIHEAAHYVVGLYYGIVDRITISKPNAKFYVFLSPEIRNSKGIKYLLREKIIPPSAGKTYKAPFISYKSIKEKVIRNASVTSAGVSAERFFYGEHGDGCFSDIRSITEMVSNYIVATYSYPPVMGKIEPVNYVMEDERLKKDFQCFLTSIYDDSESLIKENAYLIFKLAEYLYENPAHELNVVIRSTTDLEHFLEDPDNYGGYREDGVELFNRMVGAKSYEAILKGSSKSEFPADEDTPTEQTIPWEGSEE